MGWVLSQLLPSRIWLMKPQLSSRHYKNLQRCGKNDNYSLKNELCVMEELTREILPQPCSWALGGISSASKLGRRLCTSPSLCLPASSRSKVHARLNPASLPNPASSHLNTLGPFTFFASFRKEKPNQHTTRTF